MILLPRVSRIAVVLALQFRAGSALLAVPYAARSLGFFGTSTRTVTSDSFGADSLSMAMKNPFDFLKQGIAKLGAGQYDEDIIKGQIESYKSSNKVMIFSWARCPFCTKAKGLLGDLIEDPADYQVAELDEMPEGGAIRYELSQLTGRTSVPQIWIGGEYVGGCSDGPGVFTLHEQGQLLPKLIAAGCSVKES
ncbi:unnamed protein product [Choristocarpus tenellus]